MSMLNDPSSVVPSWWPAVLWHCRDRGQQVASSKPLGLWCQTFSLPDIGVSRGSSAGGRNSGCRRVAFVSVGSGRESGRSTTSLGVTAAAGPIPPPSSSSIAGGGGLGTCGGGGGGEGMLKHEACVPARAWASGEAAAAEAAAATAAVAADTRGGGADPKVVLEA